MNVVIGIGVGIFLFILFLLVGRYFNMLPKSLLSFMALWFVINVIWGIVESLGAMSAKDALVAAVIRFIIQAWIAFMFWWRNTHGHR
jgi:hypothetical protein